MDQLDFDTDIPDDLSHFNADQRKLLAQYWDDSESDRVNQQIILHWLRYPEIPDRV
jgi:hypothetical protein